MSAWLKPSSMILRKARSFCDSDIWCASYNQSATLITKERL